MVVKITVSYSGDKGLNCEFEIRINDYVDYCYYKALLEVLIERRENFVIERVRDESG